jgi:hypothetical protein
MATKSLGRDIWRLIEAARGTVNAQRRRVLISEAFELMQDARDGRDHDGPEAYRLWFGRADGNTLWIEFDVGDPADAFWAADALAAVVSNQYEEYELWRSGRFLFGGLTRDCRFSLDTGIQVTLASQRSVLETEDALLRSHRALARSNRLLAATESLRRKLSSATS